MDIVIVKKGMPGDKEHLENLARYILDDRKLEYGGNGVNYNNVEDTIDQMNYVSEYFNKEHRCPLAQIIIAFDESVRSAEAAAQYVRDAAALIPDEFQSVYCVHESDRELEMLHGHIMVNAISTKDGRQFDTSHATMDQFCQDVSEITGNDTRLVYGRNKRP